MQRVKKSALNGVKKLNKNNHGNQKSNGFVLITCFYLLLSNQFLRNLSGLATAASILENSF